MRDLLRLPETPGLSRQFTVDSVPSTFENIGGKLSVDAVAWASYQEAAEQLAKRVASDPVALGRIAPPPTQEARARSFIESFGRRAYRRPLTSQEIDAYLALFNKGTALVGGTDAFAAGVELTLQTMLQSPHFLYRVESTVRRGQEDKVPLDAYDLASRLSYALTGSMPDEALLAAAAAGKLRTRAEVASHAERLLGSAAGAWAISDFHAQLMQMGDYGTIDKQVADFPMFTPELRDDFRRETLALIDDVLMKKQQGLADLLTARHSFVNKRLAAVYGLKGTFNDNLTRVELPAERAGVLSHGGFLAANSHGKDPDAIHRGVFIAKSVLCKPLPPPVLNIQIPELEGVMTNRERTEKITGKGTCGEVCHGLFINPPGFAFESFDGLGRHRTSDHGKPVDTTGSYTFDGTLKSFQGPVDFSQLVASSLEAHVCYVGNWLQYVHGRQLSTSEQAFVAALGRQSLEKKTPLRTLLLTLVTSDAFLNRLP